MAWDLSKLTRNSNPKRETIRWSSQKKAWGIYTSQKRNYPLFLGRHRSDWCLTPVIPMFEKIAVGLAAPVRSVPLTGQTGQAEIPQKPFLRD
jgi:hypothetical protein